MKAYLLAAGYGTRLRPLTNTIPKCMVNIKGRPLLSWWMKLFEDHNITDVLINTHYLRNQVSDFIKAYNTNHNSIKLHEAYEQELQGSGGTVINNKDFVHGEDCFLICYADNITNANLTAMINANRNTSGILTMGLFHTNNPSGCGIATLDEDSRIIEFVEKPEKPRSNLANAGIYVANNRLFDYIPKPSKERPLVDFGKDVLPNLVGQMYGFEIKDYLLDIGTPQNYQKAQEEWQI